MNIQGYKEGYLKENIEKNNTILIKVNFAYPILTPEADFSDINACMRQNATALVALLMPALQSEAKAAAKMMPDILPFSINGKMTSTYHYNGVFSYFTDVEVFAGGLRPITHRYAHSFKTGCGSPIFLSSLFPPELDLSAHIAQKITESAKYEWVFGKYKLLKERFSSENFYFTPEGLAVFYQVHTLAPPAMGIPVFTIPFSERDGPFLPKI